MEKDGDRGGGPSYAAGERRHVTVLFCDICDYTALSEANDPEDIETVRRRVEELAVAVFRRHGGAICQCYGDGILAVFGLPRAHEHDARAAIDAALELQHGVRGLPLDSVVMPAGFELRLHVGIHSGLVFARSGDALHGQYDLTGDAVNTAARLCAQAHRDEILVSADALRGIEPFFEVEPVPALALKGKRLPLPGYLVRGRTDVRTRFEASTRRGLTAFVSRDAELEALGRALAEAAAGEARIVGLVGDAGIGKTRLLEEFLQRVPAERAQVLRAHCDNYGDQTPLQPFVQVLRQLFGIAVDTPREQAAARVEAVCAARGDALQAHAATLLHVLSLSSLPRPAAPQVARRAVVCGLAALTSALASSALVLAIDDWQWADDLSHEVLRELLAGLAGRPLLALLAMRQLDAHDALLSSPSARTIQLKPLSPEDSARVVRSLISSSLDIGLARVIHVRAGGNPLFIEELCHALPRDLPSGERALDQIQIPYTVQGVIQARLERLPARERELLRVASVIGNEFSRALLAQLVPDDGVSMSLLQLRDSGLLRETGAADTMRFKHGITREVIYESVRLSERRRIHASIARALEQRSAAEGLADAYEALAYHHVGSGDHERAARYAELAGDKAALTSSLDRARMQYGTALTQLGALPDTDGKKRRLLEVTVKWARAWVYDQAWDQLEVLARAARYARELNDLDRLADVEQMSAWICYALGDQQRAIEHCRRGLALAEQVGNKKLIGQLISNLGQSHAAAGEYPEALEHLQRAIALKRASAGRREHSVPVGFAYALGIVATIHGDRGELAAAHSAMDEALLALDGAGHAIEGSLLALRAMIELWQGQWERCIATSARATATAERTHGAYVFAVSRCFGTYARFMLERTRGELDRLREAVEWLEARDMGLYLSVAYGCAAEASLLAGELGAARDFAARALRRAEARDPFGEAVAHRVFARAAARSGQGSEAVARALASAFRAASARGSRREAALTRFTEAELGLGTSGGREALAKVTAELEALGLSHHRKEAERLLSL